MLGYFEAPILTAGHIIMGIAAVLGTLFAVLHPITVIVTCVEEGFNWGVVAWIMDFAGYLAAVFFATFCRKSSSRKSSDFKVENSYIFVWAAITFCVRIFDTLMLFGIVKFDDIYVTPHGAVLISNVISEIVIAFPYCLLAAIAAPMLYYWPKDLDYQVPYVSVL